MKCKFRPDTELGKENLRRHCGLVEIAVAKLTTNSEAERVVDKLQSG